jgi:uncharacterized membrane protein affecting hemolysin expression
MDFPGKRRGTKGDFCAMTILRTIPAVMVLLTATAWCGVPVIFVGLSSERAPAIEKNLTRLMEEQFATTSGMSLVLNEETRYLQSRIDQFTYPAMTARLAAALKRFAPDSILIVWGMVRECSVKPVRRLFFKAQVKASLTIELTVYRLGTEAYAYIGDAKALLTHDKGFVLWFGPIENAVQISAPERAELIESIQIEAAKSAGVVLANLLQYHRTKNQTKEPPPGITEKEVIIEPESPEDTTEIPPPHSTDSSAADQDGEEGETPPGEENP